MFSYRVVLATSAVRRGLDLYTKIKLFVVSLTFPRGPEYHFLSLCVLSFFLFLALIKISALHSVAMEAVFFKSSVYVSTKKK